MLTVMNMCRYAIRTEISFTIGQWKHESTLRLASSVSRVCVGVRMPWFVCNSCVS
jgi:hypothetical protein